MEPQLWDMHVHLDFFADPRQVAREAQELGLGMFATTVTPAGHTETAQLLEDDPNVVVGVGLHPWWVADGRCGADEVARTAELARDVRYVGEVGLDASARHVPEGSLDRQVVALEAVARACAEGAGACSPKVLSIHSVQSAGLALDVLERTGCLASCTCIFHWFSGTSDELHRAVRAGCMFSINEMMLRTRRGREYARQLPADRLLLETDLPPGTNAAMSAADIVASLEGTLERLRDIRGTDVQPLTCENSMRVLGLG